MNSLYQTHSPEQTMKLGLQLAQRLQPGAIILLFGDLGSGKTHFTKGLAEGLGIAQMIKSPTFTYVNHYSLSGQRSVRSDQQDKKLTPNHSPLTTFYHYDLYRLQPGDSFYSIGLEDTLADETAINVIEWADRLGDQLPKNYIRVNLKAKEEFHEIQIQFVDSQVVSRNLVEAFWEEWVTPLHVRAHCQQVAKVALQVGQAFVKKNILIDLNLLETAALLHDMARVCDFKTMHREDFQEEISEEKWERWSQMREKYAGQHHPEIAFKALCERGFFKTAELIRLHNSLAILKEKERFEDLETAILYYADKRVKHDAVVSLKERFEDGRERYGKYDSEKQKGIYLEVEEETFELEKKLFSQIDLRPSEIQ